MDTPMHQSSITLHPAGWSVRLVLAGLHDRLQVRECLEAQNLTRLAVLTTIRQMLDEHDLDEPIHNLDLNKYMDAIERIFPAYAQNARVTAAAQPPLVSPAQPPLVVKFVKPTTLRAGDLVVTPEGNHGLALDTMVTGSTMKVSVFLDNGLQCQYHLGTLRLITLPNSPAPANFAELLDQHNLHTRCGVTYAGQPNTSQKKNPND